MTSDPEFERWREEWQTLEIATPAERPMDPPREDSGALASTHAEFLVDCLRRVRFRFWRKSERNFLARLLEELGMEKVRLRGRRFRRPGKVKGGLNV